MGVTPDAMLDCFVNGHKSDIYRDVIAQEPTSMLHAVSLAKLYEEKYVARQKSVPSKAYSRNIPDTTNQKLKNTSLPPLSPTPAVIPSLQQKPKIEVQKRLMLHL